MSGRKSPPRWSPPPTAVPRMSATSMVRIPTSTRRARATSGYRTGSDGRGWGRVAGPAGRACRASRGRSRGPPRAAAPAVGQGVARAGRGAGPRSASASSGRGVGSLGIARPVCPRPAAGRSRAPHCRGWRGSGAGTAGATRRSRSSSARTRARRWPTCSVRARRPRDATPRRGRRARPRRRGWRRSPGCRWTPWTGCATPAARTCPTPSPCTAAGCRPCPTRSPGPTMPPACADLLARADARRLDAPAAGRRHERRRRRDRRPVDAAGRRRRSRAGSAGVRHLDPVSGLATVGAGTLGPDLEAALGASGPAARPRPAVLGVLERRRLGRDPLVGRLVDGLRAHRGPVRRRPRRDAGRPARPAALPGQRRRPGPARDRPRLGGPARRAHRRDPAHGADPGPAGRARLQPARLGAGARRSGGRWPTPGWS